MGDPRHHLACLYYSWYFLRLVQAIVFSVPYQNTATGMMDYYVQHVLFNYLKRGHLIYLYSVCCF